MKTALLLAGGGARGILQAGMIAAFCDMGLKYDMLFGTSVGAINGAMLHAGQAKDLVDLWRDVRNSDVYRWAPWKMFTPEASLFDTTPLRRKITANLRGTMSSKPFFIASTDCTKYKARLALACCRSHIVDQIMESAAAPIAFPAVNGRVDGGLMNNYNVATAVEHGARRLILMMPTVPEDRPIRNIIDVAEFLVSAPEYGYLSRELELVKDRTVEIIVIKPEKRLGIGLLDFDMRGVNRQEIITYGRKLAIDALRELIKR